MRNNKQAKKDHPSLNVSKRSRTSPILPFQNICETEIGDNPTFNLFDMSMRFVTKSFTYHRDSYALSICLIYHSRMSQTISDLCLGLPDGFKTNYHQFIIQDGTDSNQHPIYKYIDGPGYIHTFYYVNDSLYYCNGDELYLYFDEDSDYYATLVFSNGDKMQFDNNGRLVRIENGYDSNNVKTITYNNQNRLSSIIDERKPLESINLSYNLLKLSKINFYETLPFGNINNLKKRVNLTYSSGFLVNISEEPPVRLMNYPSERSLYNFRYNTDSSLPHSSYDKLEYIEDCLSHDVYKATYSYVNLYSDYLVSCLVKGYYDTSDSFVAKESIQRIGYSLRTDDWATTNEVSVIKKGNYYSYSMDKNAHITAVFDGLSNDDFSTLYKETGVYLSISGNNRNIYVNGHRFINVTNSLSITFNSDAISLLNNYRHFVLRLYLKLNDYTSNRVRANITGTGISSYPYDINVGQFDRYQLLEIPIVRVNNSISSLTISLSFTNEESNYVDVDVGDVYFDKKANTVLKFAGGEYSLNQVTAIGIYANYYDQNPTRTINIGDGLIFSAEDFLNTLRHRKNIFCLLYGNTFSPSAYPLYFNNGKTIDFYNFRFTLHVGNTVVFDSFNPGNIYLESSDTWFFETIYPDKTILSDTKDSGKRTYYLFNDDNTTIISRTGTFDDAETFLTLSEMKETYDWNEKLTTVIKNKYMWYGGNPPQCQIVSTCTTTYEYFVDGELKKAISTSNNETIVLYEAEKNNEGYVYRKTTGLNSVDVSYTNYDCLDNELTKNIVNGSTIINSLYSKKFNYDYFVTNLSSIAFKYNDNTESINTFSIDYNTSETLLSNGGTTYKLHNDITDDGVEFSVLDNNSYSLLYSSVENGNNTQIIVVNSSLTYNSLTYERNGYRMMTHQKHNGTNKVDYLYYSGIESPVVNNLLKITDKYLNTTVGKETTFTYNQIDNSLSTIEFKTANSSAEFIIDLSYFNSGTIYTFGTFDLSFISKVDQTEIRLEKHLVYNPQVYTFGVKKDDFNRLIKHYSVYSDINYKALISDVNYISGSFLPSSFVFGVNDNNGIAIQYQQYVETYSYDSFGNLSAIKIANINPELTYAYDGFGRIIGETNAFFSSYNHTYSYDSSGRLSSVDNVLLSYDARGRLISFGNTSFTYDSFGNRLTKGNDSYQWIRGTLLSQVTKDNQTYQFTYDYQGKRYQKTIGSLTISYYYHGDRLIGESRNDGKEIRYLYDETGIVGFDYYNGLNNNTYRYIKNPFNQIVGIVDNQAEIVAKYIYDAWGNHKIVDSLNNEITDLTNPGHINPIRYKGYYFDTETGLYYLLSRYYDPSSMQFISPDDYCYLNVNNVSGHYLYAYCYNNPVNLADCDGHFALWASVLIGALIGLTTTFIKDWADNGTPFDGSVDWREYVGAGIGGAIAGLGQGFLSTVVFSGLGNAIQSSISNEIKSFEEFAFSFSIGAIIGVIGYAVSTGIQSLGNKKVISIMGKSMDKLKINNRLAAAGFKNMKVGKMGYEVVFNKLYRHFGYQTLENAWELIYSFGSNFLPW